jgi:hypothetical protein
LIRFFYQSIVLKKIPDINISKEKFNEDFLGKIYLNYRNKSLIVADLLENGEKQIYELNYEPIDLYRNNNV